MATLLEVYAELFPHDPHLKAPFLALPRLPADVFAFTAHLLERSGAYHHIVPFVAKTGAGTGYRQILVSQKMRSWAKRHGRAWRTEPRGSLLLPNPPAAVAAVWRELGSFGGSPVFYLLADTEPTPAWWTICLKLLMVADEASAGIGFDPRNPFKKFVNLAYEMEDSLSRSRFGRIERGQFSLSTAAEELLCVQAKSRTPSVGSTLRSLTHHLALLPARGQVRARWVDPLVSVTGASKSDLGLLLIPFPYRVTDECFHAAGRDSSGRWGWFRASQLWLPRDTDHIRRREFVDFVHRLIADARRRGERVDGVVLPELALNFEQFFGLARSLAVDKRIDFLIAGISQDESGRHGNFVAIAPFFLAGPNYDERLSRWGHLVLVREKHHRWKLNKAQIEDYGLHKLDKRMSWWEDLKILSRSLDVLVYRNGTTISTLICEDLARVDPCQAVVRAIGPDLLIALLMDGPQYGERWPGRYATVLAEDPGTSVLSFTSMGLIARQNDIAKHPQATSIALWKDEANGAKRLELPREADALALRLQVTTKYERTLDGRSDNGVSHRWEYSNHTPVATSVRPSWVIDGTGRR